MQMFGEKRGLRASAVTLALMAGELWVFTMNEPGELVYRLEQPEDFLSRRLFLSLFCTHSLLGLLMQFCYLLVLMVVAEMPRGSVFYLPEAAAKVVLINGGATAAYWLLSLLRGRPALDSFLDLQAAAPLHGFAFLCALETVQAMLELLKGSSGRSRTRMKLLGLLCLLSVLTSLYYFRLPFMVAVGLAFLFAAPRLSLSAHLRRWQLLRAVDWRLGWARHLLFIHGKGENAVDLDLRSAPLELRAEEPEDVHVKTHDVQEEVQDAELEDESESRHAEINIADYVRPVPAAPKDADSFEI